MELISKEKVKNTILDFSGFDTWEDKSELIYEINFVPSAFEGMTNIEAIKAVFPNLKYNRGDGFTMIEADNHATRILIWDSFGDSPYKGVSE